MSADLSTRDEFAIRFFLDAIGGQASPAQYFELRYRVAPQVLASDFVRVGDPDGVLEQVAVRADRGDVYMGCAPRVRRAGSKDAIREVWTLWAECDGDGAATAALNLRPSPAMVIASGSGPNLHAYRLTWRLEGRARSGRSAGDHRAPHRTSGCVRRAQGAAATSAADCVPPRRRPVVRRDRPAHRG